MSSGGFPGAGDLYSRLDTASAGFGNAKRTLTEMERHQLQQALLLTRSVKHKPAATTTPTLHHHHPYYHASPISPADNNNNIDYSSCSSSSSATTCASSSGLTSHQLAFLKHQQQQQQQHQHQLFLLQQQHLLQRKPAGLFPHTTSNVVASSILMRGAGGGFGANTCCTTNAVTQQHRFSPPVVLPPQQSPAEVRNRLMELEKHLLDDDDDDDDDEPGKPDGADHAVAGAAAASPLGLSASTWSESIQGLVISSSSSCSTPPQPQQQQQHQQQQQNHQQPPTPTTTTSAASSCCSSSSPPTTSSSTGSPAPAKQLLIDAATAIAESNTDSAAATLAALQRNLARTNSNNPRPRSADADHRLTGYMAATLLSRINNNSSSSCSSDQLCTPEHLVSTHLLYEASPLFQLGFLAANLSVADATRGAPVIHILDFDVGKGAQLLPLLLSLADRPAAARPALVKITALSDPVASPYTTNVGCPAMVRAAGDRLVKAGQGMGLAIRFNAVTTSWSGAGESAASSSSDHQPLSRHAIGCDPDESLVVRLAFHLSRVPDESVTPSNPRDVLLRRIKSMKPSVVALAEQELSGNTAPFLPRFTDAHAHYAALFESLPHHQDGGEITARAEECLGRKAANTVAGEGSARVERCEVLGKWRARMTMAGFRPTPLPAGTIESLRARAGRPSGGGGVAVKEENGGVGFAWNGRTITVTTAWR